MEGYTMSNNVNTDLLEEARELADFWAGTMHASILEDLIKSNDLEALREAVVSARADAYDLSEPDEEVGDTY